jgi:hypothetical protein
MWNPCLVRTRPPSVALTRLRACVCESVLCAMPGRPGCILPNHLLIVICLLEERGDMAERACANPSCPRLPDRYGVLHLPSYGCGVRGIRGCRGWLPRN